MERNVDKIKQLEHELGRYRKKVADDSKEIQKLREELHMATVGAMESNRAVDALMVAVARAYGESVQDDEQPEQVIGWRLTLEKVDAEKLLNAYEIHASRGENDTYVLGVVPREAGNAVL